jgi:antitoxin component of RelBE/YafQ-DinJ toxin-antitoxin module
MNQAGLLAIAEDIAERNGIALDRAIRMVARQLSEEEGIPFADAVAMIAPSARHRSTPKPTPKFRRVAR